MSKPTVFFPFGVRGGVRGAIALAFLPLLLTTSCQSKKSAIPSKSDPPSAIDKQSNPSQRDDSTTPPLSAPPPPPPPGAYLGQVSPAALNYLRDFPILAPAYVPEGFVLIDYETTSPDAYHLLYRNSADQCFSIDYLALKPAPFDPAALNASATQSFDSPLFGPGYQLHYAPTSYSGSDNSESDNSGSDNSESDNSESDNSVEPTGTLVSDWLANRDGYYRFIGAALIAQNYPAQTDCQNVSLAEAAKIIASLADLTAAPTESVGNE
ncbi:MAG: hypothetical protein WA885_18585 [Phormidesmis sp.]